MRSQRITSKAGETSKYRAAQPRQLLGKSTVGPVTARNTKGDFDKFLETEEWLES